MSFSELKKADLLLAIIIIKFSKQSISDSFFIEIGAPCSWAIAPPLYHKITLTKRNKKLSRDVIESAHVKCRRNNDEQFQLFFYLPFPSASPKKALNHHDGS